MEVRIVLLKYLALYADQIQRSVLIEQVLPEVSFFEFWRFLVKLSRPRYAKLLILWIKCESLHSLPGMQRFAWEVECQISNPFWCYYYYLCKLPKYQYLHNMNNSFINKSIKIWANFAKILWYASTFFVYTHCLTYTLSVLP